MAFRPHATLDTMVDTLKAAAESSRLRILALLSRGDLTVSDLTEILSQSQPRVSRHLKLLLEAGLIGRYQEGSWAYFRLSDSDAERDFVHGLVSRVHLRRTRNSNAIWSASTRSSAGGRSGRRPISAENAASWDQIRSLHAPDEAVEAALKRLSASGRSSPCSTSVPAQDGCSKFCAALSARRRDRHVRAKC